MSHDTAAWTACAFLLSAAGALSACGDSVIAVADTAADSDAQTTCEAPCDSADQTCGPDAMCLVWYADRDGDGHGDPEDSRCGCAPLDAYTASVGDDCDDADAAVFPGEPCATAGCADGRITDEASCQSDGTCAPVSWPCPNGFACASDHDCGTTCAGDDECQPGYFCAAGACRLKRDDGEPCSDDLRCASGHCDNGYCCASGRCCGGVDAQCDDGNPCTTDSCEGFVCESLDNAVECAPARCEGTLFVTPMTCEEGQCSEGGDLTSCNPGDDPCNVYGCNALGCTKTPTPEGGVCAAPSCAGFMLSQPLSCDPTGGCTVGGGSEPCPGGMMCLTATSCRTTCAVDDDCQPGFFCEGGACRLQHEDGETCGADHECASAHCANGFCCGDGRCCAEAEHCDDGNACTDDVCDGFVCANPDNALPCGAGSCVGLGYTGPGTCAGGTCVAAGEVSCGGSNPCVISGCDPDGGCSAETAPAGTPCGAGSCDGFILTSPQSCDGSGQCSAGQGSGRCPGGFVCASTTACRSACEGDAHCQPGYFCQAQACLPKRVLGDECTADLQCQSGHCGNGFCCGAGECCGGQNADCDDDNPCTDDACGPKLTCSHTPNQVACAAGTCAGDTAMSERVCDAGVCQPGTRTVCDDLNPCTSDACNGGVCLASNLPPGTACSESQCVGSHFTRALTCDGNGACEQGGATEPCAGGYMCASPTVCRTSCTQDAHCQLGYYCAGTTCELKQPDGETCGSDAACASGHCNGGICCQGGACCLTEEDCGDDDNVCTAQDCVGFQCTYEPTPSTCSAASCAGTIFQGAEACTGASCTAPDPLDCEGTNACVIYGCDPARGCTADAAPATRTCGVASCSGSTFTPAATCDGQGGCTPGTPAACPDGNLCADATRCATSCGTNSDCVAPSVCVAGHCHAPVPDGSSCSLDEDCSSGHCQGGVCCSGGECCNAGVQCDDRNPCTDDVCGADFVCQHTDNSVECAAATCVGKIRYGAAVCSGGVCPDPPVLEQCSTGSTCQVAVCSSGACATIPAATGTACAGSSCSGSSFSAAATCDGGGSCVPAPGGGTCLGGYTCLDSTRCRTTCASSTECQSGYYCSSGECLAVRAEGEACSAADQCASSYCDNGTCCSGGTCCKSDVDCPAASCSGLSWTPRGTCDANHQCAAAAPVDCGGTSLCEVYGCADATGCYVTPLSFLTPCGMGSCAAGTLTPTPFCDGAGSCQAPGAPYACPNGLQCADGTQCLSQCTSDADCTTGRYCSPAGTCRVSLADGEVCTSAGQCASGHCQNGFCCASGDCCGGAAGDCGAGSCSGGVWTRPRTCSTSFECVDAGVEACPAGGPCELTGCDPQRGCYATPAPAGKSCAAETCAAGALTSARVCDAFGGCAPGNTTACAEGYACADAASCGTTCANDGDCQLGRVCSSGRCVAPRPDGGVCSAASECASGHCRNNVCCAGGDCCVSAAGCDDGNPCTADACVGNVCQHTPTPGDACSTPYCAGSVYTAASICGGATGDTCVAATPAPCVDQNVCNGTETCDAAAGGCVPGPPLDCGDGLACNGVEVCDPATGCGPGTPVVCSDGDVCDGVETCVEPGGTCVPGTPLVCNDGNPCNGVESCHPQTGCVSGAPVQGCCQTDAECSNGLACDGAETCDPSTHTCRAGTAVVCSDGDACNGLETCVEPGGTCASGAPPVCDDGNACTTDSCVSATGCRHASRAGQPCAGPQCIAWTCIDLLGHDVCQGTALPSGMPCDDGDPATVASQCSGGGCVCVPQCAGKACGPSGCGAGTCGTCGAGEACDDQGQCVALGDSCLLPLAITALPFSDNRSAFQGATDTVALSAAACPGFPNATAALPDVVYSFTPATTGVYTVTVDSDANAEQRQSAWVFTDCQSPETSCVGAIEGSANTQPPIPGTITLTGGTTYFIAIKSADWPTGAVSAWFNFTIDHCVASCDGKRCGDDGCGGSCGACDGGATCDPAGVCRPPGDVCPDVLELPAMVTGDTTGFNDDQSSADCNLAVFGAGAPDVTYRFVAPRSGDYEIQLETPGWIGALFIRPSCSDLACTWAAITMGDLATYRAQLTAGQEILVIVDGEGAGVAGPYALTVTGPCASNADCPSGLHCALGSCVAAVADGQRCYQNSDCASGYCSPQRFCAAGGTYCGLGASCDDGDPCTVDVCDATTHTCANLVQPPGATCAAASCDRAGQVSYAKDTCDAAAVCVDGGTTALRYGDGICTSPCEDSDTSSFDCLLIDTWNVSVGGWADYGFRRLYAVDHTTVYPCSAEAMPGEDFTFQVRSDRAGTLRLESNALDVGVGGVSRSAPPASWRWLVYPANPYGNCDLSLCTGTVPLGYTWHTAAGQKWCVTTDAVTAQQTSGAATRAVLVSADAAVPGCLEPFASDFPVPFLSGWTVAPDPDPTSGALLGAHRDNGSVNVEYLVPIGGSGVTLTSPPIDMNGCGATDILFGFKSYEFSSLFNPGTPTPTAADDSKLELSVLTSAGATPVATWSLQSAQASQPPRRLTVPLVGGTWRIQLHVTPYCASGVCENAGAKYIGTWDLNTLQLSDTTSVCIPDCTGRTCGDDGCGGTCGTCQFGLVCDSAGTCPLPSPGDDCSSALAVGPLPFQATRSTGAASNAHAVSEGQCPGNPAAGGASARDQVWRFTAPTSGRFGVVVDATFPPVLSAEVGTCGDAAACRVRSFGTSNFAVMNLNMLQGETAYIWVDGADVPGVTSGSYTLIVEEACAPVCGGRDCGSDGCGGTCGTCAASETCEAGGVCRGEGDTCAQPRVYDPMVASYVATMVGMHDDLGVPGSACGLPSDLGPALDAVWTYTAEQTGAYDVVFDASFGGYLYVADGDCSALSSACLGAFWAAPNHHGSATLTLTAGHTYTLVVTYPPYPSLPPGPYSLGILPQP